MAVERPIHRRAFLAGSGRIVGHSEQFTWPGGLCDYPGSLEPTTAGFPRVADSRQPPAKAVLVSLIGTTRGICYFVPMHAPLALLLAATLDVQTHTLANGMKILVHEDHDIPNVAMYLFYRIGSRHERPGATGLAHFFEHMMFNGAKKYGPKQFDIQMEQNGGLNNRG